jgi:hypothetical protein
MTMRVVYDRPPMFDEIDARFHIRGKPVIYAWGSIIYNPQRIDIPPQLMAHEAVHGARQLRIGIVAWWKLYIESDRFRLAEELPAHIAEYRWLAEQAPSRRQRRAALKIVAARLAAPLYGGIVTKSAAAELLKAAS